jgi:hypothetical protein
LEKNTIPGEAAANAKCYLLGVVDHSLVDVDHSLGAFMWELSASVKHQE